MLHLSSLIRLSAIILFFGLLQLQCRKQENGYQMPYHSTPNTQYDIPIGLDPLASWYAKLNGISTDTALFFSTHNISANQLGRITPYTMYLRAVYQDGGYEDVSSVEVSIADPTRPTLPEQVIFYNDAVLPNTGTQITLVPVDVDVTPYLINGKIFTLKTRFRFRNITQRTITTGWNMNFFARY